MSKIAHSKKFQALLKQFGAGPSKEPQEQKEKESQISRKSARDVKQPQRFDASPVPQPKLKLKRSTPTKPTRAQENSSPTPRRGRQKQTRPDLDKPMDKRDARKQEVLPHVKDNRRILADRPTVEDGSDDEFFDSASAVRSPPRGSAFSKVADHCGSPPGRNNDAQFLRPEIPRNRDPRQQRSRQEVECEIPRDDTRRDPHASMYRSSKSMRHPSREASMQQPMPSREYLMRPPMQSREASMRVPLREASMRHNHYEPDASFSNRQLFVRLTDVTRSREFSRHWDDGFLRPPTPPEVHDLMEMEKAKMYESIRTLIKCPHFTALEVVYTLNSIENTLICKMDKFCRKQDKTQSILQNTMSETALEVGSERDRDRDVETWLAGVGPAANQTSSRLNKRQPDYFGNGSTIPKRPKLQNRNNYSRFNDN